MSVTKDLFYDFTAADTEAAAKNIATANTAFKFIFSEFTGAGIENKK